jgi:DNA-binding beta-propeller fold protein YncE
MQRLLFYIGILLLFARCQTVAVTEETSLTLIAGSATSVSSGEDTVPGPKPYSFLDYNKAELLRAAPGTKSVLFNKDGSKLYAMNLEGLSIYEFDRNSRKITRQFRFKPTKGKGWDYENDTAISSVQEKPVEACLSHDDKILWVSLHNAEGIVPIWLDPINSNISTLSTALSGGQGNNKQLLKRIIVTYPGSTKKDSFDVPLIKTGKTPKIISKTADSKYLLVSNWHSYTVSVLEISKDQYPFGKVISTIPVSAIPRGIVVDDKNKRSYVAIMGGASLLVINNDTWKKDTILNVEANPRHIVLDSGGHLFISYNSLGKIACLDAATGKTLFTASTHGKPRTIILSKNQKFLFATCYSSDTVDVFKINESSFTKIKSLPCKGHPVGVDIFEDDQTLEAWVCSYTYGTISVFSFKKRARELYLKKKAVNTFNKK